MRVWIDLANSPHPVLLAPVVAELRQRGHLINSTVRDHAQTRELAAAAFPDARVVGGASPASRAGKARALGARVVRLRQEARRMEADVAVSVGSYAQILAARMVDVPALTLMDYEYQSANHLSFRLARRVAVPSVFPPESLQRFGAAEARVRRFDGFKEELYLDATIDAKLVPPRVPGRARAVFRPPPQGALYHRGGNDLFDRLIDHAVSRGDVEVLILPRLKPQRERYARIAGVTVLTEAVDGLALLRDADVFLGAGGTMSREAALLGVRAYTSFAGRLAAVDGALIRCGKLIDLRDGDPLRVDWSQRQPCEVRANTTVLKRRAQALRAWLADQIEGAADQRPSAARGWASRRSTWP